MQAPYWRASFFCLAVQAGNSEHVHAHEHTHDRGSREVAEGDAGLGRDTLTEVGFTSSRRTEEQDTAGNLTAHLLELFDALKEGDDTRCDFENFWIPLVVFEANAGFAGQDPVHLRFAQEPEERDELDDHEEHREEQLEEHQHPI